MGAQACFVAAAQNLLLTACSASPSISQAFSPLEGPWQCSAAPPSLRPSFLLALPLSFLSASEHPCEPAVMHVVINGQEVSAGRNLGSIDTGNQAPADIHTQV